MSSMVYFEELGHISVAGALEALLTWGFAIEEGEENGEDTPELFFLRRKAEKLLDTLFKLYVNEVNSLVVHGHLSFLEKKPMAALHEVFKDVADDHECETTQEVLTRAIGLARLVD